MARGMAKMTNFDKWVEEIKEKPDSVKARVVCASMQCLHCPCLEITEDGVNTLKCIETLEMALKRKVNEDGN